VAGSAWKTRLPHHISEPERRLHLGQDITMAHSAGHSEGTAAIILTPENMKRMANAGRRES